MDQTAIDCNYQMDVQQSIHSEELQKAKEHIIKLQRELEVKAACTTCALKDERKEMEVRDKMTQGHRQRFNAGLESKETLKQEHIQMKLDYKRLSEDSKAEQYLASEQLIQILTKERDQARKELMEKERDLQAILQRCEKMELDRTQQTCHLQQQINILQKDIGTMKDNVARVLCGRSQSQPCFFLPSESQYAPDFASNHIASLMAPVGHLNDTVNTANLPAKSTGSYAFTKNDFSGTEHKRKSVCNSVMQQQQQVATLQAVVSQIKEDIANLSYLEPQSLSYSCPTSVLRAKLKKALCRIMELSVQKKQLLELSNRHRAQIIATEVESQNLKRDISIKEPTDQQERPCVLEQQPCQLTMQELHSALKQRDIQATKEQDYTPRAITNNLGPDTTIRSMLSVAKISACPENGQLAEETTQLSIQPGIILQLDNELQPKSDLHTHLWSSDESLGSLREVWKVLDSGISPSVPSDEELNREVLHDSDGPVLPSSVQGNRTHTFAINKTKQGGRNMRASLKIPKTTRMIRNYNIKE